MNLDTSSWPIREVHLTQGVKLGGLTHPPKMAAGEAVRLFMDTALDILVIVARVGTSTRWERVGIPLSSGEVKRVVYAEAEEGPGTPWVEGRGQVSAPAAPSSGSSTPAPLPDLGLLEELWSSVVGPPLDHWTVAQYPTGYLLNDSTTGRCFGPFEWEEGFHLPGQREGIPDASPVRVELDAYVGEDIAELLLIGAEEVVDAHVMELEAPVRAEEEAAVPKVPTAPSPEPEPEPAAPSSPPAPKSTPSGKARPPRKVKGKPSRQPGASKATPAAKPTPAPSSPPATAKVHAVELEAEGSADAVGQLLEEALNVAAPAEGAEPK